MSGGPRFPKQPLAGRENAFRGPDGRNPFADAPAGTAARGPGAENSANGLTSDSANVGNIYAASVPAEVVRDRSLYDAIVPHRGPLIARLGLLGFLGSAAGVLVLGPIFWLVWEFLRNVSLIVVSGAMLVCIATIVVGRGDLKAIEAGAMDPAGERQTRRGYRFAWLGFGLGAIAWSALILAIFNALLL